MEISSGLTTGHSVAIFFSFLIRQAVGSPGWSHARDWVPWDVSIQVFKWRSKWNT